MDPVDAALFQTMRALFLTEAGRVAGQRLRKLILGQNLVDEFTDHRMLTGTDQIQIFSFNLIHHSVHLRKAHNAGYDIAADHERRDAVGKAAADHKVSRVGEDGRMQAGNVAHQIIEAVSGNTAGAVQIDTVKALHDIRMVGNLKIRNDRLSKALDLYILTVISADRDGRIDDIGNGHHDLGDLFGQLGLLLFQLCQTLGIRCHLCLDGIGLVKFLLTHQRADLLGQFVALGTQLIGLLLGGAALRVQSDNLVYQRKLCILKLIADVLLYDFRILPDKFQIQHRISSFLKVIKKSLPMGRDSVLPPKLPVPRPLCGRIWAAGPGSHRCSESGRAAPLHRLAPTAGSLKQA